MSNENTEPDRPIDSASYKDIQRILAFRVAGKIVDNKERNDRVAAWIGENGELFEDFFVEKNRGAAIVKEYKGIPGTNTVRLHAFINRISRRFKVWKKDEISKRAKEKEP